MCVFYDPVEKVILVWDAVADAVLIITDAFATQCHQRHFHLEKLTCSVLPTNW